MDNCGHKKVVCPECNVIISQCRCFGSKRVEYELCEQCLEKENPKEKFKHKRRPE